jgi:hypothetical protein
MDFMFAVTGFTVLKDLVFNVVQVVLLLLVMLGKGSDLLI